MIQKFNKHGYRLPEYTINKGKSYINIPGGDIPVRVFGRHNLSNIAGAYSVCEWLGISRDDFYKAIQSFEGADRRLEYIIGNNDSAVYQDFSDSPLKVKASILALKEQYPQKELVTIVELQANYFSDENLLRSYEEILYFSDSSVIFINEELVRQKVIPFVTGLEVTRAFNNKSIRLITTEGELENYLKDNNYHGGNLLIVNSANQGSINIVKYAELFIS